MDERARRAPTVNRLHGLSMKDRQAKLYEIYQRAKTKCVAAYAATKGIPHDPLAAILEGSNEQPNLVHAQIQEIRADLEGFINKESDRSLSEYLEG